MHYAARHGHLNIIKYLLPLLDNKEPKDCIVQTLLHFAAKNGHTEVVIFMIMCSKLSKTPRDFIGRPPLHLAAKKGHFEVAKLLITELLATKLLLSDLLEAKKGHLEVAKCLASVVDHVNAKDPFRILTIDLSTMFQKHLYNLSSPYNKSLF